MGNDISLTGRRGLEAGNYGGIFLEINQDAVHTDETVNATIYVNLIRPYPGDKLCLKIKGKEHTKWIDVETKWRTRPDGTQESYQENVPREAKLQTIRQITDVYDWRQGAIIPPGQFSFPVSFRIPGGLPGSFFLRNGNAVAEIEYKIEAFLLPEKSNCPKIKYKRPLTVRESLPTNIQTREISSNQEVSTWCCIGQGSVAMKTYFEKNAYAPLEVARVVTEVDNTNCKLAVQDLSFQFIQNVRLNAQGHYKNFNFVIRSQSLGRIEPGQACVEQNRKEANIQLPGGQTGSMKDYKGDSIEHYNFDASQALTPSTQGRLISSDFSLRVVSVMDGCVCGTMPVNELPVQIYSVVQRSFPSPPVPLNWRPQPMPTINLTINVIQSPLVVNINSNMMQPQQVPNISMNGDSSRPMMMEGGMPNMNMSVGMTSPNQMNNGMNMSLGMTSPNQMNNGMNMNMNMGMNGPNQMNNGMNMNMGMNGPNQMNNGMNMNMNMGMTGPNQMNNNMTANNMNMGGGFQLPQNYNMKATYSESHTENGQTYSQTQQYNQSGGGPMMMQPQQVKIGGRY